jgi:hypothetical protein
MFTEENIKINLNTEQVFSLILEKLESKKPLSIVRIGDGEIATLFTDPNHVGCAHFYKNHLGRVLDIGLMKEISKNLKSSIVNSDIIGIPTVQSESQNNPYWSISRKVISTVFNEFKSVKEKNFCSMNIHYDLSSSKKLDIILSKVDEVYLVTSRDVKSLMQKKFPNLKKIHVYKIPGEYNYEDSKKVEDYYPTIYKKIESDFTSKNFSGKLLLIGGGFVGKNLATIFSQNGGVSVDLGSIFDLFVGKITRGAGKGPNKYGKSLL